MRTKKVITSLILISILVFIDQITKYLVVKNMKPYKDEIKVLGDSLVIYYIKNTGAAWGSFNKSTGLLAIVSVVMIVGLCILYFRLIDKDNRRLARLFSVIIIAGAIGNLIDRIRLKFVVDFIYAKAINFPVFNFADICVTVSAFVLIFLAIFVYKDDDDKVTEKSADKITEDEEETTEKTSDKIE